MPSKKKMSQRRSRCKVCGHKYYKDPLLRKKRPLTRWQKFYKYKCLTDAMIKALPHTKKMAAVRDVYKSLSPDSIDEMLNSATL